MKWFEIFAYQPDLDEYDIKLRKIMTCSKCKNIGEFSKVELKKDKPVCKVCKEKERKQSIRMKNVFNK